MNSAPQLAFSQLAKPVFIKQRENQLFPPWAFAVTQVGMGAVAQRAASCRCAVGDRLPVRRPMAALP